MTARSDSPSADPRSTESDGSLQTVRYTASGNWGLVLVHVDRVLYAHGSSISYFKNTYDGDPSPKKFRFFCHQEDDLLKMIVGMLMADGTGVHQIKVDKYSLSINFSTAVSAQEVIDIVVNAIGWAGYKPVKIDNAEMSEA